MITKYNFIPRTKNIKISENIFYRPIKSWHSGTFSGEGLYAIPGTSDASGCLKTHGVCSPPLTVIHRIYWHKDYEDATFSAWLSYPNAMGLIPDYFWEISNKNEYDVHIFHSEQEMEDYIIEYFNKIIEKDEQ